MHAKLFGLQNENSSAALWTIFYALKASPNIIHEKICGKTDQRIKKLPETNKMPCVLWAQKTQSVFLDSLSHRSRAPRYFASFLLQDRQFLSYRLNLSTAASCKVSNSNGNQSNNQIHKNKNDEEQTHIRPNPDAVFPE